MKTWSLLVLGFVYIVLSADNEKFLLPVKWKGGLTLMDETGRKVYNGLSTRAQIEGEFAYVCNPRLKPGIEATLLKISMVPNENGETVLEPFPSWKQQVEGDCSGVQSAVDLSLDHEGCLWVLDVGITFTQHHPTPRCPPKIFGFNIHTGKLEKVINLANMVGPMSRLQFILADYSVDGHRHIYVADAGTKSIIAWDVAKDKGINIPLPDGVLSQFAPRDVLYLALIRRQTGNNELFFTYRSGEDLYCIQTSHLQQDSTMAKAWVVGKKPTKMIILGTDEWDCIYFRYENRADVYKWNSTDPFIEPNFHLVHRAEGKLTPTHALPDYKRGVMRISECNLVEYLSNAVKPEGCINSLTVMSLNPSSSSSSSA